LISLTAWPQLWLPPGSMGWAMPHFAEVSLAEIILMAAIGLVIGSFVNVLIHRLPPMILRADESGPIGLNLSTPRSHFPHCRHTLSWFELIPVLSFVGSFGRCKHCNEAISFRYPGVELLTAVLFCMSLLKFGFGYSALLGGFFCASLLALAWIDAETFLLPDVLTQALLWVGLIGSAISLTPTPLIHSVSGAVLGYGLLVACQLGV